MKLAVVFRPEAGADVYSARRWYENQQPGLGDQFLNALRDTIEKIQDMPRMYVEVSDAVRRAKLRRFLTSFITACFRPL
jgi:plasmid stabilization system protein ParE